MTTPNAPALLALLLPLTGGGQQEPVIRIPVRPEEAGGYRANPSTLATPLRQDLTSLTLTRADEGSFALDLGDSAFRLPPVDLALLVPRVPVYARQDEDLVRFALLQREFNRNEVKFGPAGEAADFKLANNCLRTDLWEVMLDKKVENGNAMFFHGWFDFPRDEYAHLFAELNGRTYRSCEELLARYPTIGGMNAPLAALRSVKNERPLTVKAFPDETPIRFGEQKRKAKLVVTQGIATYADFCAAKNQPIRTARFSEPGVYDLDQPVQFDLAWLARPELALWRSVETRSGPASELEIAFANGYRLLLADRDLATLPARAAAPENDKDTLRLTFGIGTPDIYATLAERTSEQAVERPNWLFLLGADGKHVDNHQAGVDRVFLWNENGTTLHLYLVGYERIAVVAHLAVPLGTNG